MVQNTSEYAKLQAAELNTEQKACLATMLGAFIGDSLGSYTEFIRGDAPNEEVEQAMLMPGGGVWQLSPGQITDDSELAMCQLRALLAGEGKFDHFHLALYYGYWVHYGPFDIGGTTANGLGPLKNCIHNPDPRVAFEAAKRGPGPESLSNGTLMRITPLAVWARDLNMEELKLCVKADASFMHSNPAMWDICTTYCLAIKVLLKNATSENRAELALQAAKEIAHSYGFCQEVAHWLSKAEELAECASNMGANSMNLFSSKIYDVSSQNMGFVEYAFVLAFYCLMRAKDLPVGELFDFSMRQCVKLQGDSDTNACIVGGLIGAYVGLDNIDTKKVKKVLECRLRPQSRARSQRRPQFIQPGLSCVDEMIKLTQITPQRLEVATEYNDKGLNIV